MIYVLFSEFSKFPEERFNEYLKLVPAHLQNDITRYVKWEDRHARLIGKLLLLEGLSLVDAKIDLEHLRFTSFKRPFLDESVDFNIAHSGMIVGCAISKGPIRIGLDLEQVQSVNLSDFENVFNGVDLKLIHESEKPIECFFEFWTRKEAVIKADGRGLYAPLKEITVHTNLVNFSGKDWTINPLDVRSNYKASIAVDKKHYEIKMIERRYN